MEKNTAWTKEVDERNDRLPLDKPIVEYLVYMTGPRCWDVAEIDDEDDCAWARNCSGVFSSRREAEEHARHLTR